MDFEIIIFLILLIIVAFLYSSIGHGGASGYLALMALFSFEPSIMKGSALILNIFVSGISFYQYMKGGYFRWKLFIPFAAASVPMAFVGGSIVLEPILYKQILAIFLLFAIIRIVRFRKQNIGESKKVNIVAAVNIGLLLGFFSGLIGIGGGIILSPIILLLHWANIKETAAVSALFIFVNSIAGLSGYAVKGFEFYSEIYIWIAVALAGGTLGAYFGAKKFNFTGLRYILAGVLLLASVKLFFI